MAKKKIYTIERDKDNPQFKRYHTMWADLPIGGDDSEIFDGYIDATDQQRNTALANVSNQTANTSTGKMGYKVLDPTKTFASQVTAENTIYEIRDVFDLGGTQETPVSVTIPAGVVLKNNGGLLKNCTIELNNTSIQSDTPIFGDGVTITGKVLQEASPEWFTGSDADKIEKAIDVFSCVRLAARDYTIGRQIKIRHSFSLKGSALPDEFGDKFTSKTDVSQTRLVANFSVVEGNDVVNKDSSILHIEATNPSNNKPVYVSMVLEDISFEANTTHAYKVNGLNVFTPGGPSRPMIINKCRFYYLNYGVYSENDKSGTYGTNYGTASIYQTVMAHNKIAIYCKGDLAVSSLAIRDSVIEQNEIGGIITEDNPSYSIVSAITLENVLLEGQPKPIWLENAVTGISVIGCYFENASSMNGNIYIKGSGNTYRPHIYFENNTASPLYTFSFENCIIQKLHFAIIEGNANTLPFVAFTKCKVLTPINEAKISSLSHSVFSEKAQKKSNIAYNNYLGIINVTKDYVMHGCLYSKLESTKTFQGDFSLSEKKYRICFYCANNKSNTLYFRLNNTLISTTPILTSDEISLYVLDFDNNTVGSVNVKVGFDQQSSAKPTYISDIAIFEADASVPNFIPINGGDSSNITNPYIGFSMFDDVLGKYVMWNGTTWVNLDGTALS